MIFPESFISIAEDSGLIIPIGRLVLRQACIQAKEWMDQGMLAITIAVNISALEFRHHGFFKCVREILQETGMDPTFLQFELTESVLMRNVESSQTILHALKEMGVQLAVDDFGTGYSSLSYLSQFPIDVLKIDQSFVRDISANKGTGMAPISIAVNISALEFRRKDFFESICRILEETGMSPRRLQLEITESVLMRDAASSASILKQFKKMGVQLAVDDFGTGYSSLSYLKEFPIDVLKIDQSFVQGIGKKGNGVIIGAVIAMGFNLRQRVIAEGVEHASQLDFLKEHRCDEGQGYLFSRPLEANEFAELFATGTCKV